MKCHVPQGFFFIWGGAAACRDGGEKIQQNRNSHEIQAQNWLYYQTHNVFSHRKSANGFYILVQTMLSSPLRQTYWKGVIVLLPLCNPQVSASLHLKHWSISVFELQSALMNITCTELASKLEKIHLKSSQGDLKNKMVIKAWLTLKSLQEFKLLNLMTLKVQTRHEGKIICIAFQGNWLNFT